MKTYFQALLIKRLVLPAFFCFIFISGCESERKSEELSFSGSTMGTTYSVKLIDEGQGHSLKDIQTWVDSELVRVNDVFSTYISDSELSLFNKAPVEQDWKVSSLLCKLILLNMEISDASEGRYDVTTGPLVNLWGFGPEGKRGLPTEKEIRMAKSRVGYRWLKPDCDKNLMRKLRPVYVDLSASAKGYGTDILAELLVSKGYRNAMIEIGGELRLLGVNSAGKKWRIAVEKPTLGRTGGVQVLNVSDVAVATSGDYRNYYEVDGQRVSHTIDPITAAPIRHKLASVTVVMPKGAEADAWATAFNVLGPEAGFELAESENIPAYFLVAEGDTFSSKYTSAFEQYMVKL